MKEELISVLMCAYNEPMEYICQAVKSITEQTYRNIEFIIIIDHPDRRDIVSYLDGLADERIRYHINEKNMGLIASLNKGLQLCSGKLIARMDADDIAFPDRLERQYEYTCRHDVDILGGQTVNIDETGKKYGNIISPVCDQYIKKYIGLGGGLPHPTWFVKQSVYRELGGYRNIKSIEDYDFLVRGVLRGYQFGCLNEPCLYYRKNTKGISQNNKGRQRVVKDILRRQYKQNRCLPLEEIQSTIESRKREIQAATRYYRATRSVRIALEKCSAKDISVKDIVCIVSSKTLYLDFVNMIRVKMAFSLEKIFIFTNAFTKKYDE